MHFVCLCILRILLINLSTFLCKMAFISCQSLVIVYRILISYVHFIFSCHRHSEAPSPSEASIFVCALTDACVLLPPEEGYVKMFLKGRPVTMFMPRDQVEPYCLEAKADLPGSKLKLDWVYPLPW